MKAHKWVSVPKSLRHHAYPYHCSHFNLEFQTGAFLQLILTLTAISSRVAILLTEIESSIELGCEALCRFLLLMDVGIASILPMFLLRTSFQPTQARAVPSWIRKMPSFIGESVSAVPSRLGSTRSLSLELSIGEDTGIALSRSMNSDLKKASRSIEKIEERTEHAALAVQTSDFMFVSPKPQLAPNTVGVCARAHSYYLLTIVLSSDNRAKGLWCDVVCDACWQTETLQIQGGGYN